MKIAVKNQQKNVLNDECLSENDTEREHRVHTTVNLMKFVMVYGCFKT